MNVPRKGKITRLWLAMIEVSDLSNAIEFYHKVLGLPIALDARKFNHAEVGPEDPQAKIGLHANEKRGNDRRQTGVVLDTDDIFELHKRLKKHGVVFTQEPTKMPWGSFSATFLDPDNNELEVVEDPEHYVRSYGS